ncbi:regulator of chromosome condensation 1/beta-lactamase-inhibitor protein II [Chytriomyces sp. MP71]|nr:regulator of chromosome condensation 1/beta-lactamase-inhibitor protein II [Chytriomyces sp. MP71]
MSLDWLRCDGACFCQDVAGTEHFPTMPHRQKTPILLPDSSGLKFSSISAGESHFVAICTNGTLLGWGMNGHGQLGRPCRPEQQETLMTRLPLVLPAGFAPQEVYASGFSTFVTGTFSDRIPTLFTTGANLFGELGVGSERACWFLTEVTDMKGVRVRAIKGGLHHTLLLDASGDVWAAGRGDSGQLGLGDRVEHTSRFKRVELPEKAVSVCCSTSGNQSYVITEGGSLYSFGFNCYGQLGLKCDDGVVKIPQQAPLKSRKALLIGAGCQFAVLGATQRS